MTGIEVTPHPITAKPLTIQYRTGRDMIDLTPTEVHTRLTQAWEADQFPRMLGTAPDVAGAPLNPYWEIVRLMRRSEQGWGDPWAVDTFADDLPYRKSLAQLYAWSIPSPADIFWLQDILAGRGVVEIGAGSGYWAWQLRQLGIDVDAVDNDSWGIPWQVQWSPVRAGGPEQAALHPDRALLLVWPPYDDSMAHRTLTTYTGDLLVYAGEGSYGCTGDDAFHDELERSWTVLEEAPHHPTFDGIHCRLIAYRRKAADS